MGAAIVTMLSVSPGSAQSQADRWNMSVGMRETRQFDRVTNGVDLEDRIADSADASLGYSTRTERATVSFSGRAGVNHRRKPETDENNRLNYGAAFSWSYRASSRSEMRLTQTVAKNLRLQTLSELGVYANDFDTTTATTNWSFQTQTAPRTSWGINLGYGFREFGNTQAVDGSQIVLDEDPFVDDPSIPTGVFEEPPEFELPDGENDLLRILATEGLTDTGARSHRGSAGVGFNHGLSDRTSLNLGVSGGYRSIGTGRSREGSYGAAQIALQRYVSSSSAVNVGYTLSSTLVTDPGQQVHTLYTGWSYSPTSSSLSIRLFGGASHYEAAGFTSTTPVANVSLSGALTSSTTAQIAYHRQFSVSRGYGRSLLIDYVGATVSQSLGERATLRVFAGISFGSSPLAEENQRNTRRAGASFSVRLIGGLRAGTSYYYSDVEQVDSLLTSDSERHNASFFLSYSADW